MALIEHESRLVLIRRSEHPVRFVRLADHEFFQVLRYKLGWGLPHVAKPGQFEYALSNSFGFGGTNGSLIFKRV